MHCRRHTFPGQHWQDGPSGGKSRAASEQNQISAFYATSRDRYLSRTWARDKHWIRKSAQSFCRRKGRLLKIKAQIPNALTLLNLLFGVIGIVWVLDGRVLTGAYFVLIAAGFDFLDGFAARLLKVQSDMGKELDSLADVVSFGVLPGLILFMMTKTSADPDSFLPYLTLIVPMLSAYRLAKFNLDTRQSDRFIGLPTPANALLLSTLPYLALQWSFLGDWLSRPIIIIGLAWIFAILLVSEIPLIALKFKNFTFSKNKFRYILIVLSLVIFASLQLAGIPLVILVYIGLSVIENATESE
jgi:CDP-diacylglycerol--serine O-phosphatidyltransferase